MLHKSFKYSTCKEPHSELAATPVLGEDLRDSDSIFLLSDEARMTIFNNCIGKGISAGLICIYGVPGEVPSSPQQLKLQEPCPLLNLVTLAELLQLSNVVMKRKFHQLLHIYK